MKKIVLILALAVVVLSGFTIVEQEYIITLKTQDINFISGTLDGIKQNLANSTLPSNQTFAIFKGIDSVETILRKNISAKPNEVLKEKKN